MYLQLLEQSNFYVQIIVFHFKLKKIEIQLQVLEQSKDDETLQMMRSINLKQAVFSSV